MRRLCAGALLGVLGVGSANAEAAGCAGPQGGSAHTVTRILDAETVALDDGRELRLIGALAPRAIDVDAEAGAWAPEVATTLALRGLLLGKSITLGFASERTDRYGRLQAQAFLIKPEGGYWVQGHLLRNGLARAYTIAGGVACSEKLLEAERPARDAKRGLWAEAAYRIRRAGRPAELLRYLSTFQVVEGRILGVGVRRTTIYLNFARNWRRGFSVSLRRRNRALLGVHAARPRQLRGRLVRVRGWIARQRSGAPIIDLSAGGLIEMLPTPRSDRAPASLEQHQRRAGQQDGDADQ